VFRFALNQELLTQSPVVDLDLKIKLEQKRGHFTDPEARKIFEVLDNDSHIKKNEWQKWAVLFGAYTGARAGEVTSLQKEDFELDESGIWSVIIRGTKTKNALRQFPVPPELIDKGFMAFVGEGHGLVFPIPETKSKKNPITSFFPRVLGLSGVPKLNSKNLSRSFHSFRHSVVTKTRGNNFDEALTQQIIGHEKTGAGITDTYTHDFTAMQLLPVVASIKY
jgi:integrase